MTDLLVRFSLSANVRSRKPEEILEKIMVLWNGSSMRCPKKFLAENGGEFSKEEFV